MPVSGRVSVVVTTYNHAAFVDETIRSVLDQDYPDVEIVVADDGSGDDTPERITRAAAADSRIVPILSPTNDGIAINVNRALDRTTGEFIAPLSGDDLMLGGKLSAQVAFLNAHPECGVCTHDMDIFESTSGATLYRLGERFAPKNGGAEVMFTTNWLFGRPVKSIPSSHMIRASVMGRHRLDPRLRIWNEWLHEIDYTVGSGLRWSHLPEVLGRYRVHDRQTSTSREAFQVGLEEMLMVLAIASTRYPQLARLIKRKREFILFNHLVFDWIAEDGRAAYEELLRVEAGRAKWVYLKAARYVVRRGWLIEATRPARRAIARAIGSW